MGSVAEMLRQALGEYGERIRTVRGLGYSFEGDVIEEWKGLSELRL